MIFSSKYNFGCIAIQWLHTKHYFDYQYTKIQPYTSRPGANNCFCTIHNFGSPTKRILLECNNDNATNLNVIANPKQTTAIKVPTRISWYYQGDFIPLCTAMRSDGSSLYPCNLVRFYPFFLVRNVYSFLIKRNRYL